MSKQLQIPGIGGCLPGELIVDLFAGGGGASTGIEAAVGRPPDIAINHDPAAIKMHAANHPATRHLCESIYDVDPVEVTNGQAVGLLWASPSCTHFSRARGGTPVSKQERGLGWQVPKWCGLTGPRLVFCENVPEWETWGPVRRTRLGKKRRAARRRALLGPGNSVGMQNRGCRPLKDRAGEHYRQMVRQLDALGYDIEWRVLNAAELNTATIRKRLYVIARRDGEANTWPEPETGPKAGKPVRTAAEHIDWSDLGRSIFGRKKPLAEATCRRIAAGIVRYVIEAARPFIVTCNHSGDEFRGQSVDAPMRTITASRDAHGVVSPVLVSTAHGDFAERNGRRVRPVDDPMGTIARTNNEALCTAFLAKYYGGVIGHGVEQPLGTVTKRDHNALVAANIVQLQNNVVGRPAGEPLGTVLTGGHHALSVVHLSTIDQQSNRDGMAHAEAPLSTVTSKARHTVVAAHLVQTGYGERKGQLPRAMSAEQPLGTIVAQGCKAALVAAFLTTYYKEGGTANGVDAPIPAIVTKARHGLVTVDIDGTTYAITDIKLRMLKPEELAGCQGFPKSYVLTGTQEEKIGRIGNSVCPPVAEALVRAQLRRPKAKRGAA